MTAQSTFTYRARDSAGQIVTGSLVAASADEVGARLRAEGKYVVSVEDKPLRAAASLNADQIRRNESAKRVKREDVIAFCQQLSVMLESGVPLSEAMDSFGRQATRREMRDVLTSIMSDLQGGEPLSTAMSRWPRVFPTMIVSLMKASEASGTMGMMLGRIGQYLDKERRTLRQVKGALSYPLFMMFFGVAMTVFLVAFVLPRFAKIYADRSASLPTPTKILMSISEFLSTQYLYYVPGVLAAGAIGYVLIRKPAGRRALDWLRLHTPVIRGMYRQLYLTRMARTMATLLHAGVNLLDIIDICRGVTNNVYYDEMWQQMENDVRGGRQMSETLAESSIIAPQVASMMAAGERSGRLPHVMERLAEFAEQEFDSAVKHATSYVEPVMIIFMGILVGGIAMALLLPIFSMGKVMSGG
jgi:type IV pilus assembly protein PilC